MGTICATAIAAALKGVEGAFVLLPAVWAPSPDYREAKGAVELYESMSTRKIGFWEYYRLPVNYYLING